VALALVSQAKKRYPDLSILLLLEAGCPDACWPQLESQCGGICLVAMWASAKLLAPPRPCFGGGAYMDVPVARCLHRTKRGQIDGSRTADAQGMSGARGAWCALDNERSPAAGIPAGTVRSPLHSGETKLMARNRPCRVMLLQAPAGGAGHRSWTEPACLWRGKVEPPHVHVPAEIAASPLTLVRRRAHG